MNAPQSNELQSMLRLAADAAYIEYVNILNRDECRGTAVKFDKGEFRWENLQQFCRAHEQLGRHRALHEVLSALEQSRG